MSRKIWITRDGQGNLISSTEIRSSSGCSGCLWALLGVFVVVAPAAWASNGDIPASAAVVMYVVEAVVAVAALIQNAQRRVNGRARPTGQPPAAPRSATVEAPRGPDSLPPHV